MTCLKSFLVIWWGVLKFLNLGSTVLPDLTIHLCTTEDTNHSLEARRFPVYSFLSLSCLPPHTIPVFLAQSVSLSLLDPLHYHIGLLYQLWFLVSFGPAIDIFFLLAKLASRDVSCLSLEVCLVSMTDHDLSPSWPLRLLH